MALKLHCVDDWDDVTVLKLVSINGYDEIADI